ncbi:Protein-lysine N-methyltransferase efm4 [Microbotryomycetes sp. JL221]|nr:Protein-lysine N-methyltransferase efm4 [Microbotryomycetes sp. JL221]
MSWSASSLAGLKAELSKKEAEFNASKHLGSITTRSAQKSSSSSQFKQNKSLAKLTASASVDDARRASTKRRRNQVKYEDDGPEAHARAQQARAILEKKAKLYDKIKRGKTAGLTEGQISNLLVDFDRKQTDSGDDDEEDDASQGRHQSDDEDLNDPLVEYEDEFGRVRKVRRSELPRQAGQSMDDEPHEANIRYGDQVYFPVYQPDPEVLAARKAAMEESAPLVQHYDASKEVRARGAGFMSFSKDEQVRQQQMEALQRERVETIRKRQEISTGGGVEDAMAQLASSSEAPELSSLPPSRLGTKAHWDSVYERECKTFQEIGDEGEVWFGEDSADKMVQWVERHVPDTATPILDVGTGNGQLLFALAEAGYTSLTGVDYSAPSTQLAQSIAVAREVEPRPTFITGDILSQSARIEGVTDRQWRLITDKGTMDAICLSDEQHDGRRIGQLYPAAAISPRRS